MPVQTRLFCRAICLFLLLCVCSPAGAGTAYVKDDGNNLRARGGPDYRQAPILDVLNQGDYLRVWQREGKWARVTTPEGVDGFVNAACLAAAADTVQPQALDQGLRERLVGFLASLRSAAESREWAQLAALLDPAGVFIQHLPFPDASRPPAEQARQVTGLFYATDVSLTYATAAELLLTGADPPRLKLFFDRSIDRFRPARPGEASDHDVTAEKQAPLFPGHLKALALAPRASYVPGFPQRLLGVPEPASYLENPAQVPFAWVFQVGPGRYFLAPYKRVGLALVLTDKGGRGLTLRAVYTQSP
jgi:hypothetical protein